MPGRAKLRAGCATAFRSSSFLDLYGQSAFHVGNPGLRPEQARGWNASIDLFFAAGRSTLGLPWLETRHDDLIVFDFGVFPGTTANVDEARTRARAAPRSRGAVVVVLHGPA